MGNCISAIRKKKEATRPVTLALVGLDNAGKTTISAALSGETIDKEVAPTIGFRDVNFQSTDFKVTMFDLGGGKNIRSIWKNYFSEVYGVVYVLDATDRDRIVEARDNFRDILEFPQVSGKPVLVLANKTDIGDHMEESDIINKLQLAESVNINNCPSHFVMISAYKGTGNKMDKNLKEGLNWILGNINSSIATLEPRVEEEKRVAKEASEREKEERRARVKKKKEERERQEALERSRLGEEEPKEEESDDDVITGDPFQTLDLRTLTEKDLRIKEENRKRKEKLKTLDAVDTGVVRSSRGEIVHGLNFDLDTDVPRRSRDDLFLTPRGIRNYGLNETNESEYASGNSLSLFGRNTRTALPPLEPLGSKSLDTGIDKKKTKKKKKLNEYQAKSDNIPNLSLTAAARRNWHETEAEVHDLTPRYPDRRYESFTRSRDEVIDEDDYEKENIDNQRFNTYPNLDRDQRYDKYLKERENSTLYRQSLKTIMPPEARRFEDDEEDEGIVNDSEYEDEYVKYRKSLQRQISENESTDDREDINELTVHSSLKDTLRYPLDPNEYPSMNGSQYDYGNLSSRREKNQRLGSSGYVSRGYEIERDNRKISERAVHSPSFDSSEEMKAEPKKKKKRNLLKSNKIAAVESKIGTMGLGHGSSPRMVQEKNYYQDSRGYNSSMSRNVKTHQQDTDFASKWGLAEDLPAIDNNNYNVRTLPDFSDDD